MRKIIVTMITLLAISLLAGCSNASGDMDSSASKSDSPSSMDITDTMLTVDTPYGLLDIPSAYRDEATWDVTSQNPYTLAFKTKEGKDLFSLSFGGQIGSLVGTLKRADENIVIYADIASLDESDPDYEKLIGLQQGINTIIACLDNKYDFVPNEVVDNNVSEQIDTFDIPTDLVTLKYPVKWKGMVDIDVSDRRVDFSYSGVKLFSLSFGEDEEGYILGEYDGVPISIVSYDGEGLTNDEEKNFIAMQNDVNVIIQNLSKDEAFTIGGK